MQQQLLLYKDGLAGVWRQAKAAVCYTSVRHGFNSDSVLGSLSPAWETQIELLAPGLGLAELWPRQKYGEWISAWNICLPLGNSFKQINLPRKSPKPQNQSTGTMTLTCTESQENKGTVPGTEDSISIRGHHCSHLAIHLQTEQKQMSRTLKPGTARAP